MLPRSVIIEVREYVDRLNSQAAAKVATALIKLSLGIMLKVSRVRSGMFELRIDFGPGYQVYFGKNGEPLVILVGGDTKQHQ